MKWMCYVIVDGRTYKQVEKFAQFRDRVESVFCCSSRALV